MHDEIVQLQYLMHEHIRCMHVQFVGDALQHLLPGLQFETKTAQHLFCKTCGVCSYYVPRSNPDGFSVTVHCIDPGTVDSVVVKQFDGKEWEKSYASSGIKLQSQPS